MKRKNLEQNNVNNETVSVILIRHAQSLWNEQNRFSGWADPPLTKMGIAEAMQAGKALYAGGYRFDIAYSSRLQRAIVTTDLLLQQLGQTGLPRIQDWRLNERHYGSLQGANKAEVTAQAGEHQVWRWRRGYEDKAAPLLPHQSGHPANDPLYADVPTQNLPGVENLAQTRKRVMQFWQQEITPRIKLGQRILISAHGNTLRALIMDLAGMSVAEVEQFEIPTAQPIIYRFSKDGRPRSWRYLLADAA